MHFPPKIPSKIPLLSPKKFPGYSGLFRRSRFSSPLPGAHPLPPEQILVPNMPIPRKIRSESHMRRLAPPQQDAAFNVCQSASLKEAVSWLKSQFTPPPSGETQFCASYTPPGGALNQARAVSPSPQRQSNQIRPHQTKSNLFIVFGAPISPSGIRLRQLSQIRLN